MKTIKLLILQLLLATIVSLVITWWLYILISFMAFEFDSLTDYWVPFRALFVILFWISFVPDFRNSLKKDFNLK